jgi:predicted permease
VGASRARLVRQFLTESVLLSFTGGLGGIVLAYGMTHALSAIPVPSTTPFEYNIHPDFHVLTVTLALALVAGIGFGLAPALASVRADIGLTLKEGAQAPLRGYRRFGLRNLFVAGQMAASLMLLVVTWYVAAGFLRTARLDPGFEVANLNLASVDPVRDGYSEEASAALFAELPDELSRIDGVRAAALADSVPFANLYAAQPNTRMSAPTGDGQGTQVLQPVFRARVGAGYFAALGAPPVGGREFDRRDGRTEPLPAILNQTAARALFGSRNPIGRPIREGILDYTVVGVTRDAHSGILMAKPVAAVFLPLQPEGRVTILVRGTGGRNTLAAVRDQLAALHPDLTVFNVHTMRENLDRLNWFIEWDSAIYVVLGLFALLLASIGLGGVTAYAVVRRRKEIGIRMALGARDRQVRALVLREGMALIGAGLVFGLGGAFALEHALATFSDVLARTFDMRTGDPLLGVGAGVSLLLAGLAMLACYLPARRATRIDPVAALREQ